MYQLSQPGIPNEIFKELNNSVLIQWFSENEMKKMEHSAVHFITLIPYLDDNKSKRKENHHTLELSRLHYIIQSIKLVQCIQQHINTLIHHDQLGFIPALGGLFNISQSMNANYHINEFKRDGEHKG